MKALRAILPVCLATLALACGGRELPTEPADAAVAPTDTSTDTGPAVGAACSRAGELGCQGIGQKLQLLCDGSKWISNGVCSGDMVCDPRPGSTLGSCQTPACKPGVTTCDGASILKCTADLLTTEKTACLSAEHCKQSVGGVCAKCLSWDARCEGATLLRCSGSRQELTAAETCATAALCNATGAKCNPPECAADQWQCTGDALYKCKEGRNGWDLVSTCAEGKCDATAKACAAVCAAGEHRCTGDVLESCNAGGTAFDPVKVCAAGLCDAAGKECDECTSGAVGCVDATTPRACDSTGKWKTLTVCSGSTPTCVEGVCKSTFTKTTVTFPSSGSTLNNAGSGTVATLGVGGAGILFKTGDYVEEKFLRSAPVSQIDFFTKMSDYTTSSTTCPPVTMSFAVKINGVQVGTYSWLTGSSTGGVSADKTISKVFTFSPIAPGVGGTFIVRYESLDTVCGGGGSYNWYPGGSVTLGG